jgi:hypothetical protein
MAETCNRLMVIRHGEKPDKANGVEGVSAAGVPDKDELAVRGWQRAGALVRFFHPLDPGCLAEGLAVPRAIFATRPTAEEPSKRSLHTVKALAEDLGLQIGKDFGVHQEKELLAAALQAAPEVLICWHHERIARILAPLGIDSGVWPDEVFDRVLVADRRDGGWTLAVVHQHLLPGDS